MSPKTMKAYQFSNPTDGLVLTTVPIPTPLPNQLLVRVHAAGLCHTDCNIVSGSDNTFFWRRPITLGHEIAGEVVSVGSGVTQFREGDNVVSVIGVEHPVDIKDVLTSAGIGYDGGFAEYVLLYERKTLPMPQGISFADAAVATDAVATALHAVVGTGQVKSGMKVAIIGLGGLGLAAAQIASRRGAKVYAIELDQRKYPLAMQKGGVYCCAKSFKGLPGIRFDVILDFAGVGVTTATAAKNVKVGGQVVLVGLAKKHTTLQTHEFVAFGVTLIGSAGASKAEVKEAMKMVVRAEVDIALKEIPFGKVREGLQDLEKGKVLGRLWTDPSKQ